MLRVNNEKYDVIHENFDGFFEQRARHLTEPQKNSLPRKLMVKLFRRGGRITTNMNSNKLTVLEKIFVLFKAFKSRWFIVVEDESGGGYEEWVEFKKQTKKKELSETNANRNILEGHFFLANKELSDAFSYVNEICTSLAYGYLIGAKNSKGIAQWRKERQYIARFIVNYEAQKKRITVNMGITLPEWYVLVYIYNDKEVQSSSLHKDIFKYSFGSSATQIKRAVVALQDKGMVVKTGKTKGSTIKITAQGSDYVNQIMSKYIINC